jgi:hypothetical protein
VDELHEDRDGQRDQAETRVNIGCDTLAAMVRSGTESLVLKAPAGLIAQKPYNTSLNWSDSGIKTS